MKNHKAFVQAALEAEYEVAQHGLVYDAEEVFAYIRARMEGLVTKRPLTSRLPFTVSWQGFSS